VPFGDNAMKEVLIATAGKQSTWLWWTEIDKCISAKWL
jgi:hypothetical protein